MKAVYCAGGNPRFYEIATAAGFEYGARLPDTVYGPLFFADQEYKSPDRAAYMAALARHRPYMATVIDWMSEEQLPEVLDWSEEAAQYVKYVVIIPKVMGGIGRLPRQIGGRDVVLGYSVPTKYGGTELPAWEFAGWPVHLLGGSPHKQMAIWRQMVCISDVVSADGNYAQKMAVEYSQFWTAGTATYARNRYWPRLDEAGEHVAQDAPYEAFRRSCANIMAAWRYAAAGTQP